MKRLAFTMIELVLVIVVLGILASLAMPRMQRDIRQEAADNILSAIRYTQHLAILDRMTEPKDGQWQRKFWRFGKAGCSDNGIFYYIGADKNKQGGIDEFEAAVDPQSGHLQYGLTNKPCANDVSAQKYADGKIVSKNIFLTKMYGIKENDALMFQKCTGGGNYIGFDHLGRPHVGFSSSTSADYSSILQHDCNLTFTFEDTSIPNLVIQIEKETGYATIIGEERQ